MAGLADVIQMAAAPGATTHSLFQSMNEKALRMGDVRARPTVVFRHPRSCFQEATAEVGWDGSDIGVVAVRRASVGLGPRST